jgi:hypothetical protein
MKINLEDLIRVGGLLADALQSDKMQFAVEAAKIVAGLLDGVEKADTDTAKAAQALYTAVAVQEKIVFAKLQKIIDEGD